MPPLFDPGISTFNEIYNRAYTVGATAVKRGDLVKLSAGLIVGLADNDKQGEFFVCLSDGAIGAIVTVSEDPAARFRMVYTGSAPTVGLAYGVSDSRTLDQTDTTNKLLTILKVEDSANKVALVKWYRLTS